VAKAGAAAKGVAKAQPLGVSELKGVRKATGPKLKKPWQVAFWHQGKVVTGGRYATAEEASVAQDALRRGLGYTQPGFFNSIKATGSLNNASP
jgi:hypothetical protein